ncbi:pantoate--beta-alanine ligase [Psychrobium sp. 1_MG-2023]|uniref:pantoate--beta-alanine ligase n=1 Tax=Psychrobium sp. 1_MG-2023 TaxID=3062624 RepID=UPI000C33E7CB|nr:pantoate--beta-alanine ligase [Psychrobium sp. 1_MG-2023]MDP2561492.1 pantoate--beta-alanine ligase [Psychrobium sp. 1_MG-2023]PKF57758.1 pantoate--beta-alanine ligase [Alteromonadales bacterium alter-6D02]
MLVVAQTNQLREQIKAWQRAGETIAFVPTMGNLHTGHLTLVEEAKQRATKVVVSIFVNPMQFDNKNDLTNYPRTLEQDSGQLIAHGVDMLFTPTPDIMYPKGLDAQTFVEVPNISNIFCGESRPGHFRGVATIVAKLFNLVTPDVACFGVKDYQQLRVIKLMVEDLSMDIDIVGVDTVREESGLAKSSRNGYLNQQQLTVAPLLYQVMQQLAAEVSNGQRIDIAIAKATETLNQSDFTTDYIRVQRADNLGDVTDNDRELVILAAANLGPARLIDNLVFKR